MDRLQILYLTHRTPYPPNRGDRIRTYHVLKYLSERHDVYLASLADEPVPENDLRVLQQLCQRVQIIRLPAKGRWVKAAVSLASGRTATEGAFRSQEMTDLLNHWLRQVQFDAVVASCSSMAQFLFGPGIRDLPAVVDLVDVDSQKWFDYAADSKRLKRLLYRTEGERLRRFEHQIVDRAIRVLLVNAAEASLFQRVVPNERTVVVPNGVDFEYFQPDGEPGLNRFECVFVGVLDYRPNIDGLMWFCSEVWPLVRQRLPDAGPVHRWSSTDAPSAWTGESCLGSMSSARFPTSGLTSAAPPWLSRRCRSLAAHKTRCWRPWPWAKPWLPHHRRWKGSALRRACMPNRLRR